MSNLEMDVIICTTILIAREMASLFIIIVKILSVCARASVWIDNKLPLIENPLQIHQYMDSVHQPN